MGVKATLSGTIDAPLERVAELIRSAIGRLSWQVDNVNTDLYEFNAFYHKQERIKGINWKYTFRSTVTWEPSDGAGVHVTIEVREEENNWTEANCKEYCEQIFDTVSERAAALEKIEATKPRRMTHGSARFAELTDMMSAGYLWDEKGSDRLVLGALAGGKIAVPPEDTIKHALVCGPTGSGKTSSIFIPNLIERLDSSAIVTEATAGNELPDLYSKTAGYRERAGRQRVYYFNPDDLSSNQINPLDVVNSVDSAQHLANLIIQNTNKRNAIGGDPIWETSERHLLTSLILHAVGERGDLALVRRLMKEGPEGLHGIFLNSKIQEAQDEYLAFYKNSTDGFRNGVTSGLMQRLNLWVNPRIAKLTEKTDFDVKALAEQLFTFYIAVPAQKTQLKPLAALIFNFVLDLALQQSFKHPLALMLDEFANFGWIPAITEKLTIIRHRKIPAVLGIQDYVQLQNVYGLENAKLMFSQPGTKVFFRPRDLDTAKKISDGLGTETRVERKVTSSGQINEREFGRPLMAPSEVMAISDEKVIVFTPVTAPMLIDKFDWRTYQSATKFKPPERSPLTVDEALTLVCRDAQQTPEWQSKYKREKRERNRQTETRNAAAPKIAKQPPLAPESEEPEIQDTALPDDDFDEAAP